MPHSVGKVVLHRFLCPFIFNLDFQFGRRRPFWISASTKFRGHFREGHGSSFFSNHTKVSNLTMLSAVTGLPDITQLIIRLWSMATNNMHMKFEIEIPKQTRVALRKPCQLQSRYQNIQYGHQAVILKVALLKINRLIPIHTMMCQ